MNVEIVHNYVSKNLCNKVGEKKEKVEKNTTSFKQIISKSLVKQIGKSCQLVSHSVIESVCQLVSQASCQTNNNNNQPAKEPNNQPAEPEFRRRTFKIKMKTKTKTTGEVFMLNIKKNVQISRRKPSSRSVTHTHLVSQNIYKQIYIHIKYIHIYIHM